MVGGGVVLGRAHLVIHATLAPQEGGGGLEEKRGWETRPLTTKVGRGLEVVKPRTDVVFCFTSIGCKVYAMFLACLRL